MGCVGGKQSKNYMCTSKDSQTASNLQQEKASQMISSLLEIANNLEDLYTNILQENTQIPEKYALLHPSEFLQKLRETDQFMEEDIDRIEQQFNHLFKKLSVIINQASLMLFDYKQSNLISEEKKNILLTFIMLYESTCQKFINYYNQRSLEKSVKTTNSKIISQDMLSQNQQSRSQNQIASTQLFYRKDHQK
ncbi:hypothetical protein TTHERM_00545880 (macronuclear) [Tetrahymena thermophila SB210]|uniref:Uncharacterized protein n=1 Tax=Tetrahymena thermophila (strain SB210) TaxID=312017 RepID=I7M0A2_TETTS|nr:hypothetical protein TTHERM_00545880 [Tetrahymena thermophila SB210]EAR86050.1 hypothetical protein TTHERM_00545880 [Tetrahymena thermophila SB210]|eukprot:XP_976645.1 hypothetical protein TTHERM_00545880 [Tetrahymena thermophila SB210]